MKRGGPRHPKMGDLAARLGVPRYRAVGIFESLLHFGQGYARRGDVGKHRNESIAKDMEWDGDADALLKALVAAGFVDECPCHRLRIHDWPDHCDQAVKRTEEVKRFGFLECYQQPASSPPDGGGLETSGDQASSGQLEALQQNSIQPVPLPLSVPLPVPVPEAEAVPAAGQPAEAGLRLVHNAPPPPDPSTATAEDERVVEQLGVLSAESAALATELLGLPAHRATVLQLYQPGEPESVSPADVLRLESRIPDSGRAFGTPRGGAPDWRLVTLERVQERLPKLRAAVAAARADPLKAQAGGAWEVSRAPNEPGAVNDWNLVLAVLETHLNRHSFATWFRPTTGHLRVGPVLWVGVPNGQFADWLTRNYAGVVAESVIAAGLTCEVKYCLVGTEAVG